MGRHPIEEITEKQREVLRLIILETEKNGCQPSRDELAAKLGTTKHAVNQKVWQLCKKGYLVPSTKKGERCLVIPGVRFRAELVDRSAASGNLRVIEEILEAAKAN
jgi:biotin operon repressor